MTPLKDCRDVEVNVGDFVIYVVQGNRNAGINFGYILELNDKRKITTRRDGTEYDSGDISVKIQHADADGTRKNALGTDVPAHWRADTPQEVLDYHNGNRSMCTISWEEYWAARREFWIEETLRDTGVPSTTRINCAGGAEHRLLVTKPYV